MNVPVASQQDAERKARRIWITFVVILLGLQLTIGGIAIGVATADRSAAIVPNYHSAALNWDADRESRSLVDRLGWSFHIELADTVDAHQHRALRVWLRDQSGQAVDHLRLRLTAFHHSHGRDVAVMDLDPIGDGGYQCLAPMAISGLWELDFTFEVNEKSARVIRTMEVH